MGLDCETLPERVLITVDARTLDPVDEIPLVRIPLDRTSVPAILARACLDTGASLRDLLDEHLLGTGAHARLGTDTISVGLEHLDASDAERLIEECRETDRIGEPAYLAVFIESGEPT